MVRRIFPSSMGSSISSSRKLASSSIEKECDRVRLRYWSSLPFCARLGKRDSELRKDGVDCRLGPLNMNAAGDTMSTLGTEPYMDDSCLDLKLEALDLNSVVPNCAAFSWLLPKIDVMYL
jgi:hypothetical protein